jgi:serine/threonine-protein kinase SRPK3
MVELGSQWSTEAIDTWLKENPPRTHAPERSLKKMVTAYVSQSFPPPSLDALASYNFKLADFSSGTSDELWGYPLLSVNLYITLHSAQFVSDQTTDDITPLSIRPPEVVLGGQWNESVDIWTFGCMVSRSQLRCDNLFELLRMC